MDLKIALLAPFALLVAGCVVSERDEDFPLNGKELTISAICADNSTTKTIRDEADGSVLWMPGDAISLFYGSGSQGGSRFVANSQEPTKVAKFTGTINAITGGVEGTVDESYFWGLYPYSEESECDGSSVAITLPSDQIAVAGSFANNLFPSIGQSKGLSMGFYNVCGGVRFSVTREGINKVTLRALGGEKLAGKAKVGFDGNVPTVLEISEGSDEITLSAPDGECFEVGAFYYFVAFPQVLTKGIEVRLEGASEEGMYAHKSNELAIKRSVFGTLRNIDQNVNYYSKEYVPIVDPAFKSYLVDHFDLDGDEELSFYEASLIWEIRVTTTNVETLKGIEYFKNLEFLRCYGSSDALGKLSSLDLRDNKELYKLECYYNSLKSLDVSGCEKLHYINCDYNQINDLKVSGCSSLETLRCYHNQLNSLDLSGCSALRSLSCYNNMFESLDLTAVFSLTGLNCLPNESLKEVKLHLSSPILANAMGAGSDSSSSDLSIKRIGHTIDHINNFTKSLQNAGRNESFILDGDLDFSELSVVPTPQLAESFNAVFDGCGYQLTGINARVALFGQITGVVKNLIIGENCQFTPKSNIFGVLTSRNEGVISGVVNKAKVLYHTDCAEESVVLGSIVGVSSGEISDCVNEGQVAFRAEEYTVAAAVGGIVGYQSGMISDCVNKGNISYSSKYVIRRSTIEQAENFLPTIGGVVGLGAPGFVMDKCDNYGVVDYKITAAETGMVAKLYRNQIGGIVGSPCGDVSNCHNYGDVTVSIKHSIPGTELQNDYRACVGGIGGGDYGFTNISDVFSNSSYINCVNEGNITVDSDAHTAYTAIGGIVGWPGQEKPVTGTSVNGCTNKGNITGKGIMKCRIGGIEGGTGVIENSENQGVITIESANVGSAVGSLCAFHSQGHAITGCTAGGEVVVKCDLTGGVGGLIGNVGNVEFNTGAGCKVNCKITVPTYNAYYHGMVVGRFNGTTKTVVLGSADSPIEVSGSINGTSANADNIFGKANNENHTIFYLIK